jgi:hypothetical protein
VSGTGLTAFRNLGMVAWNRAAKQVRGYRRQLKRAAKAARESAKHVRAEVRRAGAHSRDSAQQAYSSSVKTTRSWDRWGRETWAAASLELSVRRELRAAARGSAPIVVGPWLGEVGYEALYWVPFVRWFADHYRVDRDRLIVVSRGGVAGWYEDIASQYMEILELFTPEEVTRAGEERRAAGDQKQLALGPFDQAVIARVRERVGRDVQVCHPSAMFRLLRRFWLGTDSVQHVFDHTMYRLMPVTAAMPCPPLPSSFVAVKLYTGRALPDSDETRRALGSLLERVREGRPIVLLDTGLQLDEHRDYGLPAGMPVITLGDAMTPQNNLGLQTEVIRRADLFVGTCGSLAWLSPLLGTETLAVYTDDYLLAPHIYAAGQVYRRTHAASFTPVDLRRVDLIGARGRVAR